MNKEKLAVIGTGGTIAALATEEGAKPGISIRKLIEQAPSLEEHFDIKYRQLFRPSGKNSTLIDHKDWIRIIRETYRASAQGNPVLITHGTDTLAYTSSAISFAIQNPQNSIVLTASMKTKDEPDSDVPKNLSDSTLFLKEKVQGVYVVFDGKVMMASRITKVSSVSLNAFETVDGKHVAVIEGGNVIFQERPIIDPNAHMNLINKFDTDVFTLKLTPGLPVGVFDMIIKQGFKAIVIESFGTGGISDVPNRGLLGEAEQAANKIPVVVTTQTVHGGVKLKKYEVGMKIRVPPFISGEDMTSEACHVKLMWCLGQGMAVQEVRRAFERSYAGEITVA